MAFVPAPPAKSPLDRHRLLSPTAAVRVSPLCLGGMNFGDAWKGFMGEVTKEQTFEILDMFYDNGGNFIDTANIYQSEQSESWIGEWMIKRKNREEMVIATKYTGAYKRYQPTRNQSNFGGNSAKSLRVAIDSSLKNLQTDYVDILYVHYWDYTTSIPELMLSLNQLVKSGKVIYLGISDTPAWIASKANQYARDHGLTQFSVYQGSWSAAARDLEGEIVPMCLDEGMGICPYGTLPSGKFKTEAEIAARAEKNPGRYTPHRSEKEIKVTKVLETLAEKKKTKLTSVALAYIMHKTTHVFPIVGGRNVEQLKDNIDALSIALTDAEIEEIEDVSPYDPGFPHTFLSGSIFNGGKHKGASKPSEVWMTTMQSQYDWVEPSRPIAPAPKQEEKKE